MIDCDVHPIVRGGMTTLLEYLPRAWKRRFEMKGLGINQKILPVRYAHPNGDVIRVDATPPGGGPPGSDPAYLAEDLCERHGVARAILNSLEATNMAVALADPDESVQLVAAYNDFYLEQWLPADPRFRYALVVSPYDPQAAAAEIRRIGGRDGVVGVSLPLLNVPMGNRYYDPIYAAAQELELPVLVHPTGTECVYAGSPVFAGGQPQTYIERYVIFPQVAQTNVASLILNGVFERFPRLKVVFVELGFSWAVPLMWRMDTSWNELRVEVPWVKRRPSEYLREHIRLTTQPVDEPERQEDLDALIEGYLADVLVFSSDYPHWDNDMPGSVFRTLKAETQQKIFAENAAATFPRL